MTSPAGERRAPRAASRWMVNFGACCGEQAVAGFVAQDMGCGGHSSLRPCERDRRSGDPRPIGSRSFTSSKRRSPCRALRRGQASEPAPAKKRRRRRWLSVVVAWVADDRLRDAECEYADTDPKTSPSKSSAASAARSASPRLAKQAAPGDNPAPAGTFRLLNIAKRRDRGAEQRALPTRRRASLGSDDGC